MTRWLGIDFGTSNTSAATLRDGVPVLLDLEPGRTSVPSAVFLDFAARRMLFGTEAVAALVDGRDGRLLRAVKRVLGTPLMREPRQLLNRRMTLLELLVEVLALIRTRAEAAAGHPFTGVLAGRPVIFQPDPAQDAQAARDLAEAYALAGFQQIAWLTEPEAAARASGVTDGLGLVVDIGGGTSDFTLFRADRGRMAVLGTEGLRLGGTDADRILSLAHVMPGLGLGSRIRAEFGPALHDMPVAIYHDLATWERIGFLNAPELARSLKRLTRLAEQPRRLARLQTVVEDGLGFDIAFAVEAGKIAANDTAAGQITLGMIEPGLRVPLEAQALARDLAPFAQAIADSAARLLARTATPPGDVTHIVHVGGSSLLAPVRAAMAALCPQATGVDTAAFTAVAEGLAIATADLA
jgi:hypothetical chaperone protein